MPRSRSNTGTLRPEKREAILRAARTTFARSGLARATIDAIAAEADVSTRTIYKHFAGKDELLATVLTTSAEAVGDDYEAAVRDGVAAAGSTRGRLLALARAGTKLSTGHPEHFAMIRRLGGELDDLPPEVHDAWRKVGPGRVDRQIRAQLRALRDEGELDLPDLARAVRHFRALAGAAPSSSTGRGPAAKKAADEDLVAGVDIFLRGYAPR